MLFKQIIAIDKKLLNISRNGKNINTKENTELKIYLLKRIAEMRHNKKLTNKIKYQTIFEYLNIKPDGVKKKRLREKTSHMLQCWKDEGYIIAFKEYKLGKSFEGVELQYKPEDKQN